LYLFWKFKQKLVKYYMGEAHTDQTQQPGFQNRYKLTITQTVKVGVGGKGGSGYGSKEYELLFLKSTAS
ncbi:MAG: hypothetical protein AAFO03_16495, partial [Bacteroidota bacterium]